jgi:Concanavalin A-like lectin/glucanases superfamily/VanZ like family
MNVNSGSLAAKTLFTLRLLVLAVILVAGLWPFHVPRNEVNWLEHQNGLNFGRHGVAISVNAFRDTHSADDVGNSLEIWLTPEQNVGEGSILAFDSSLDPRAPFRIRQYDTSIAVQRHLVDERGNVTRPWLKVDHVLSAGKRVLVSITSDRTHTRIYVDGTLAGTSLEMGIEDQEFTGRLILAKSTVDDGWSGQISGLAIYRRELTSEQVRDHFKRWTSGMNLLPGEELPVALYRFDEHAGSTIRSLVGPMNDMTIPDKYFVLHPAFLRPTWEQYSGTWNYWKSRSCWEDWAVNIGGFMPVGFVFFASANSAKSKGHRALLVVLLGFSLSFTIEALQRLLPTRDSGMTDLFTNTAGTALGVFLHRSSIVRAAWIRVLHLGQLLSAQ